MTIICVKSVGNVMIEEEVETINEIIIKREKAKASGNEAEAKSLEELLKKAGFEVFDNKDSVSVSKFKKKANI